MASVKEIGTEAPVPVPEGSMPGPSAPDGAGRPRLGWILAVCCVAQFMVILDLSIVNVALPSIQVSLGFSSTALQWVIDAYAIVFAGFLMLGGRAADHFGQRRTFAVALALFSLTSLLGGLSVNSTMLILARAAQGLSGALMAATSLAIITASFAPGPARHRAVGLWGAMNGAGGAVGTLAGGVLTQEVGWRWILLINPPIGLAAAAIGWYVVMDRRRADVAPAFDFAGALTLTAGQLVLVYGIVRGGEASWTAPGAIIPMAVGAVLLLAFGLVESRFAKAPLVPLKSLTRPLKIANLIVLLFSASLFSMWYVSSLYLQQVLGLSPLATGLAFLPMALAIFLTASQAGRLVGRFGVRAVLGGGLVLMTTGMLLLARIGPSGSAIGFVVLPGVLTAAGIGLSIVPSTIFATQGAGAAQAGLASGLVNTSRQAGGGLGLAIFISVATQHTSAAVGHNVAVPSALTDGFRIAYLLGAACVVGAAAVTFLIARPPVPATAPGAGRQPWQLAAVVVGVVVLFAGADFGFAGAPGAPIGTYTTRGSYSYVSAPGLHPPRIAPVAKTVTSKLAPGYIMVANFYDLTTKPMMGQSGPLVLDDNLQPVWFRPVPANVVASNLERQTYLGHPVLTWWQGVVSDTGETESGEDVVVDEHYHTVATLKGQDGWVITLHEMLITGHDAWVTANRTIPMDISRWGGSSSGILDDSAVQEYDLRTGRLLYTWDALKHIPLSTSHAQPPDNGFPWDAYHVNSISLAHNGDFLVSMRSTWAAYMVDARTGSVLWQLGGKHSTFALPSGGHFEWQHDVKLVAPNVVSLFNDNCCEITGAGTYLAPAGPSAGLELRLNQASHTASVLGSYEYGPRYSAAYMGDMQPLANGNVFVGWGSQPNFTEYTKAGKTLLNAAFPGPDLSYRAVVSQWAGMPTTLPRTAVRSSGTGADVYVSWNGATKVARWRLLVGLHGHMTPVGTVAKTGFETALPVPHGYRSYEVQALDASGKVLATSKPAAA
ncbi:MAG TPA: MFS transporter [Acidimicrobiales bacterium]|nr:MFS transporter [Acidimicrobiales bacterium]